jgi:hypothetical protein
LFQKFLGFIEEISEYGIHWQHMEFAFPVGFSTAGPQSGDARAIEV